jgi:hypothetical protein
MSQQLKMLSDMPHIPDTKLFVTIPARGLVTSAVHRYPFQFRKLDTFQAARVDSGGIDAMLVLGEGEGRAAAVGAELMLDDVLVEGIGLEVFLAARDFEVRARYERKQKTLAAAVGAVAFQYLLDVRLDLVFHLAAVAAAVVFHVLISLSVLSGKARYERHPVT